MAQAWYNGSQVSTMDADGLVTQHQSISRHSTDLMDVDGPAFQHQGMSSNSTDLMCS